jgi:hypothetical protein
MNEEESGVAGGTVDLVRQAAGFGPGLLYFITQSRD